MAGAIASRLRKLAEVFDTSDREATQAWLLAYFAGPEYEGHREALVRALVAGRRSYCFERYDAQGEVVAYYMVWWNRGGRDVLTFEMSDPPVVRAILLGDERPAPAPTRPPPPEPAPVESRPPAPPEAATHGATTAR